MRALLAIPWCLLALAGGFSLLIECGFLVQPLAPDLDLIPARLAGFELLEEIPVEAAALGDLPPQRFLFRRIRGARGAEGRLFAAYYRRAQRWSGRPHDVDVCYESMGWQERQAERLDQAPWPWSRVFEREGRSIRVLHWLERPGDDSDAITPAALWHRISRPRGLRPDVVSIYLEFPAEQAPARAEILALARELSAEIEGLWRASETPEMD